VVPVVLDEFKIAALVEGSIDEVLSKVISDIQLATDHCIQLKEEQYKSSSGPFKRKRCFCCITDRLWQKFDLPSFRTSV
jgi:hypothetical protein